MESLVLPLVLILNAILNTGGTMLLKQAAISGHPVSAVLGCALYSVAAALYLLILQTHALSIMAVITSSLSIIASISIGIAWFGESLTAHQWCGLAFSLIGLFLMSWPQSLV